ncbi:MAG: translocation/assembly module TamB [Bacteroidaceae bacterium]|nr:translocation/assembly module TamB [Bacteroidaceae bacterium]
MEFAQQWMARTASRLIFEQTGIRLSIERLHPTLVNRIVLDNVQLLDQCDSVAFRASRIAARVDIIPLLNKQIRINGVQLLSAKAHLYQDSAQAPLNIQYVIDALAAKDTATHSPIDLQVRSLVLRNCEVRYERLDASPTPHRFNPCRLSLSNVNLTADLNSLTPDHVDVEVRRLSAQEASGLDIRQLALRLKADKKQLHLQDFLLEMPRTQVVISSLQGTYDGLPTAGADITRWLQGLEAEGVIRANITPADVAPLVPTLKSFTESVHLVAHLSAKDGRLQGRGVDVYDEGRHVRLQGEASASKTRQGWQGEGTISDLSVSEDFSQFLAKNLDQPMPDILQRIGAAHLTAQARYSNADCQLHLDARTDVGQAVLEGTLGEGKHITSSFTLKDVKLGTLLHAEGVPSSVTLSGGADVSLPPKGCWPEGNISCTIAELTQGSQLLRDVRMQATSHAHSAEMRLAVDHPHADVDVALTAQRTAEGTHVQTDTRIRHFCPQLFGLIKALDDEHFDADLHGAVLIQDAEHIRGMLAIDSLALFSMRQPRHTIGTLTLTSDFDADGKHLTLTSQPLTAHADGKFQWSHLSASFQQIAHHYLPDYVRSPRDTGVGDEMTFNVTVQDTVLARRLAGVNLSVPRAASIRGHVDSQLAFVNTSVRIPELHYAGQHLNDLNVFLQTTQDVIHATIDGKRLTQGTALDLHADLFATGKQSQLQFKWDNNKRPSQSGNISVVGTAFKDERGRQNFRVKVEPSRLIINDTVWHMRSSDITYHANHLQVNNLGVYTQDRHLNISGTASKQPTDTLVIDLHKIDISYILNLVNFHSVEFAGDATGRVYGAQLFEAPQASAFLHIDNFTFNEAPLGQMNVRATYDDPKKGIVLDALVQDKPNDHETRILGNIVPGEEEGSGLELNIRTHRFNLAFINFFTKGVISDLTGRASGTARVFGPFETVDLEGDMRLDEARMHIDVLGTTYTIGQDSVIMRPGIIAIPQGHVYDEQGTPHQEGHTALVNAKLMHRYLNDMYYDLQIDMKNFLGYNQPKLGVESFCGVAYADGNVHLTGGPNRLQVDVTATPTKGSSLTYNATQPDKLTEANFIRFKRLQQADSLQSTADTKEEIPISDTYLNFDVNVTPDFQLKVLMDTRSGDNIALHGNGHLRATYYNKGKFQLYGTYHVEEGNYEMSFQEFVHKQFRFQKGGRIVFGGNPGLASLNLQAAYTVPNVSLDDLSTTSLGLSNTRVDCIMKIGGQTNTPTISFDFELPNAGEEEQAMVRSILSSEEERNSQVIYLLGIGRFFRFDETTQGLSTQSTRAMNSLLSSTLSNQFNRALSNIIGSSNWSFGTNLRTGDMGWNNLDVEGMLSGRLFNNRLLINGNFGYRERYYTTQNFVGDFDVQYLVTPSGSIALKAYNKSNDRYFVQSSLNTQGIGIQFKKEFRRFVDLFKSEKKKR